MIIRSTTVLCVRRAGRVAMGCDGQVTVGTTVMKHNAKKLRRLHHEQVLAGFAGATADAFTLFEKFEAKLEEHRGNLTRAAVELAKTVQPLVDNATPEQINVLKREQSPLVKRIVNESQGRTLNIPL